MSSRQIARRFFEEVCTDGKLALVDELFTPDYVGHPSGPERPTEGRAGVPEYLARLRGAFADLRFNVEDHIVEGDTTATRWTARGTHRGDLMGIEPTGRSATVTGITIQRIRDGMIAEGWTDWGHARPPPTA